ncbi:MAG: hypothetical protein Q4B34_01300 [Candidatus Saccharibacteria bacterium]|nr:hypothetical protein [Candidatus Saccharibacteria bacterium]
MKKAKAKQDNKYKIINIVFACLIVALAGALVYCGSNMYSAEDKEYLALQDHLLNRHVEMMYEQEDRWQVCEMDSRGISKDNDVYVRFWCQTYDTTTGQPAGETDYRTLYFQHRADAWGGYAEALGD